MENVLDLIQLTGGKRTPVIRQTEAAECGLACLAMIAAYYGRKTDLATLRRQFAISIKGMSLQTLIEVSDEIGLTVRSLRADLDVLHRVELPAICHWDMNHFLVLTKISGRRGKQVFHVNDPAHGALKLSEGEFSKGFTGVVLEISKTERFQRARERSPLRVSQMWSKVIGLNGTLLQILALSLCIQMCAFAAPFFIQLSVDTAIPSFDQDFLATLAIGFGALAVFNQLTSIFRDLVLLRLGTALSYQLVTNLFRHLIRLPIAYFERRHTGDIISRFDSTQPITDLLTHGLIQGIVDGIMAFGTLGLMFFYSPLLAATTLCALATYALIRIVWFKSFRLANAGVITARAAETSTMIETVRGIAAIKLSAREGDRQRFWQHKKADVINSQIKIGKMQIFFDAAASAVIAIENIIFVYLAARLTIKSEFTVGMIFAFGAYKSQFMGSCTRLIGQIVQYQILDVHLTRIADIALTQQEGDVGMSASSHKPDLIGDIEVKNLSFSYGRGEKAVLRGATLKVRAGETVAIAGKSGCGKTTLLKILLGYYPQAKGKILIDGEQLQQFGLRRYRKQIGAVLQDDTLYAGTLAENIAFFSAELDMKKVIRASQAAIIHDEIVAMTMGYESLVGDMGSSLSGGQKQRVLLARALYNEPKILFIDEGTAHLDVDTEAAVNKSISSLGITRVIVAHRPETLRSADRTIFLEEGKIVEPKKSTLPEIELTSR